VIGSRIGPCLTDRDDDVERVVRWRGEWKPSEFTSVLTHHPELNDHDFREGQRQRNAVVVADPPFGVPL
jgi:hypothetical protein